MSYWRHPPDHVPTITLELTIHVCIGCGHSDIVGRTIGFNSYGVETDMDFDPGRFHLVRASAPSITSLLCHRCAPLDGEVYPLRPGEIFAAYQRSDDGAPRPRSAPVSDDDLIAE